MQYDIPKRPEGTVPEQIEQLWEALFRLTEQLNNAEEERAHGTN